MTSRSLHLSSIVLATFIPLPILGQSTDAPPKKDALAVHWKNLAGPDAEKAYAAMRQLSATPKETIEFLREIEKPAALVDVKVIEELIRELSNDRFAAREKAYQELERHDRHAVEPLKKALLGPIDLETKRRVDALLARQEGRLAGAATRGRRMIEIMEWIGAAEAKGLLANWSQGAPDARLTQEARHALKRWPPPRDADFTQKEPRLDSAGDPLPAGAVLRLGSTRWRVSEPSLVRGTFHFTPDNKQLIVSDSEAFRIVNIADGKMDLRVPFGATVRSVLLTPDQRHLVATGHALDEKGAISPSLCVWDWKNAKKVGQWNVDGTILNFANKGAIAVLESAAGIRQIDVNTGQEVSLHPTPAGISFDVNSKDYNSSAALNDNLIVVPRELGKKLSVYDWSQPENVKTLAIPGDRESRYASVAFSPGNKFMAHANRETSPSDGGVTLYDVATLRPIRNLTPKDSANSPFIAVDNLVFSPNGKSLAFSSALYRSSLGGYDRGEVVIWDLEKHKVQAKMARSAWSLVFSSDSRFIAGRTGSQILIWDTATGKELTGSEDQSSTSPYKTGFGYFPNGRGICVPYHEFVSIWDIPSGKLHARLAHREVNKIAVSPDNRLVSTGSYRDNIRVWDIATATVRFHVPQVPRGYQNLFAVAFSPIDERVNVWADDAVLRSWNTMTGRLVSEVRLRPDGIPAVVEDDDMDRRQLNSMLAGNGAFSFDGTRLLWDLKGIHIFDASSGKKLESIDIGNSRVSEMSTNADLEWLLLTGFDGRPKITLYNLRQQKLFGDLRLDQARYVPRARISPDGRCFAIANSQPQRTIDLFETATMQRRLSIPLINGAAEQIAFSPSGRYLAVFNGDGTVLVYDVRCRP